MTMQPIHDRLRAPFPKDIIKWRIGNRTKDKTKGCMLAYIDARDVITRLDEVVGFQNWQCRYPWADNGKVCCDIGIRFPDEQEEWVWKSNGAGSTDVEADKGAFSDAFKRAAVMWGIGAYLYELGHIWVKLINEGTTMDPAEKWKLDKALE